MIEEKRKGVISKVPLSASVPVELKEELISIMKEERISYSEIVTDALRQYIDKRLTNSHEEDNR